MINLVRKWNMTGLLNDLDDIESEEFAEILENFSKKLIDDIKNKKIENDVSSLLLSISRQLYDSLTDHEIDYENLKTEILLVLEDQPRRYKLPIEEILNLPPEDIDHLVQKIYTNYLIKYTADSNRLPKWSRLKNEVGYRFNDFNIIRGDEFINWGKDVWVGYFCLIDGSGGLDIGDNVTISSGAHIYTHDSTRFRVTGVEKDSKKGTHIDRAPVKIGNNVQIGANSTVLMGVTIGNNVIIGANSLVNKDIPDNCIAAGVPAKVLKKTDNWKKYYEEKQ